MHDSVRRPARLLSATLGVCVALVASSCTGAAPPAPPSPPQPTPSGSCTAGSASELRIVEHGKKQVLVASGLADPEGLAVSTSGIVYVSDVARHAVYQVISPKKLKRLASFGRPMGLALGCYGDIYVADNESGVKVLSAGGAIRTLAAFSSGPLDVAFDESSGDVYASTAGTPLKVARITPAGKVEDLAPGFVLPWGIAFRGDDLLVYDQGFSTVYEVRPGGAKVAIVPTGSFMAPSGGLAVGRSGEIFVSDSFDVKEISTTGKITTYADGFVAATALATDESGALYVADAYQHAVFRIDP